MSTLTNNTKNQQPTNEFRFITHFLFQMAKYSASVFKLWQAQRTFVLSNSGKKKDGRTTLGRKTAKNTPPLIIKTDQKRTSAGEKRWRKWKEALCTTDSNCVTIARSNQCLNDKEKLFISESFRVLRTKYFIVITEMFFTILTAIQTTIKWSDTFRSLSCFRHCQKEVHRIPKRKKRKIAYHSTRKR